MPKLGALLLRGFQSRRVRRAVDRRFKSKRGKKPAPRPTIRHSTPPVTRPSLPETITVSTGLMTQDLIRPGPGMKASIEAFLLDLRSEHTRRAYGKDLKRFVEYLVGRQLQIHSTEINRGLIIGYKDYLIGEKLEHTTIDRHLATLKSFFGWLVDDGVLQKNPAENVRFLNPKRESRTQGFTDEEVRKVLAIPDLHTKTGSLHYAVLMVLFYCGLRRSELCSIRTANIGYERGHRFVRLKGKGNTERIVVLVEPVWKAIEHYLKMANKVLKEDQPLFSPLRNRRTGVIKKPLDPSMVFYVVTRCAKIAGIRNRVSPHSCRATAISNARDHQVPDRAIQEFAGWATPNMITRYDKRKSVLEKSAVHAIDYGAAARTLPSDPPQLPFLPKK